MVLNRFKCYRLRKHVAKQWKVDRKLKTVYVPQQESKVCSENKYLMKLISFYNYQIQFTL